MKRITIHEGTEPKNLAVDKLVTALTDGGEATWVPEDETQLSRLTATRNGRYRPASGFYGFSDVDVYVEKTYPSPGENTPIKPAENSVPENAVLFMVGIAGSNGSIKLTLPRMEICNGEKEGVVNMVDFSNAKIEALKYDAINIRTTLGESAFYNPTFTSSQINSGSYAIYSASDTWTILYYGKFNQSGNWFYIGGNELWKVTGVQFSADDTYAFEIVVHFRETEGVSS